jgi:hypothetical protein
LNFHHKITLQTYLSNFLFLSVILAALLLMSATAAILEEETPLAVNVGEVGSLPARILSRGRGK